LGGGGRYAGPDDRPGAVRNGKRENGRKKVLKLEGTENPRFVGK